MKKILSVLLLLTVCVAALCGCALNIKPLTLDDSMEIPEDGIVPASVFERLQKENKVMAFFGQSGDTYYEWTVFGNDVETPQDTNMKLEVTRDEDGRTDFSLCTEADFSFSAVLSIHSSCLWTTDDALVYYTCGETAEPIASASVTGSKASVLNFSLTQPGQYSVVSEAVDDQEEQTASPAEESKAEDEKPEADPYLSASDGGGGRAISDGQQTGQETHPVNPAPAGKTAEADLYLSASDGGGGRAISDGKQTGRETHPANPAPAGKTAEADPYLSASDGGGGRVISDGQQTGQDAYLTDPVPEGKPMPVEPENQKVDEKKSYTCTFSIECFTVLNNLDDLNPDKLDAVPSSGVILSRQTVTFYAGESVYDVLQRVCKENGIHMEASWTPIYNSAYVEGIHNLYEFDCGTGSGWMYRVNGWYPNYGCSRYQLAQGDHVEWRYTCDLGADIGGGYAIGG